MLHGFFMFLDPSYIIVLPALLLGLWAQYKVKSTFTFYSKINSSSGKTAAQIAQEILNYYNLSGVRIEKVAGHLTDHYDPSTNIVRLSESVYDSKSIASIGVAAHEVGHAVQHAQKYAPITIRNAILPVVNIASFSWWLILLAGIFLHTPLLIKLGIIAYASIAIFQLITLPLEFDASKRALKVLKNQYFSPQEFQGAKKVLTAAGMTYVAALVASLSELLRLVLVFGGNRDND